MREDLRVILEEWNPWWDTEEVPTNLSGHPRQITDELAKLIEAKNIAKAIIGPRRAGKTTVMYQLIDRLINKRTDPRSVLYLNLEDPRLDKFSINEIYLEFMRMNKPGNSFIFLDEVHQKKEWARWVRTRIDLKSNDNIFLSGSTSRLISKKVAHLLAGRVFIKKVYPFSFKEILDINKVKPIGERGLSIATGILEDCLKWGCYPAVVLEKDKNIKINTLISYFETIVSRDISTTHNLNADKSDNIFRYILKNSGDLTSVNKIKNVFKISYETAEKYIEAMKDAMVIIESRRYAFSLKEQMAFPRKFYPVDLGLKTIGTAQTHEDIGKRLETFIAEDLIKNGYGVFYESDGGECDIVITDRGNPVYALQVTKQLSSVNIKRETKGLNIAKEKLKIDGEILTMEDVPKFLYLLGNGEKVFK